MDNEIETLKACIAKHEKTIVRLHTELEAATPAQPAGDVSAPSDCLHDDTVRQGAIWTACQQCGKRWADDEVAPAADVSAPTDERAILIQQLRGRAKFLREVHKSVKSADLMDKAAQVIEGGSNV